MGKKCLAVLFFGLFASAAIADEKEVVVSPYLGCYPKTTVEKLLTDGEYVTLYRGNGPDGRVNEIWINGEGRTATIAFKTPKDSDASKIKDVCVTNVTKSTVFNALTLEILNAGDKK